MSETEKDTATAAPDMSSYGTDLEAEGRRRYYASLSRPATTPKRFTCRRCGEHRDTTVRGHCDDCEA